MSSIESTSPIRMMPYTHSVAMKLAYRMIQVFANLEKIKSLFATNVVICIDGQQMDKDRFFEEMKTKSIENIRKIGEWSDSFSATDDPESTDILWRAKGFQYRLGMGLKENGAAWYKCDQVFQLSFIEEEGQIKISSFVTKKFEKTFISCDLDALHSLPRSQKIIHKLAYRSFQIPQQSDKLSKLYDSKAIIFLRPNEDVTLEEFRAVMSTSNTENVVKIGTWINRYLPDSCCPSSLRWNTTGRQERRGLGYQEPGPGCYDIGLDSRFHFTEDKKKIALQDNLTSTKVKVEV